jgi:hypothetical protein
MGKGPRWHRYSADQVAKLAGVGRKTLLRDAKAGRVDLDDLASVLRYLVARNPMLSEQMRNK